MPILAQNIVNQLQAALDAENSDYYTWTQDFQYALKYAVERLMYFITNKLGSNRFNEEATRELMQTTVWTTSSYSRISLPDSAGVWQIVAVQPLPTTVSNGSTPPTPPASGTTYVSYQNTDQTFISSTYAAKRLQNEAYVINSDNPFEAGYNLEPTMDTWLVDYAYREMQNYNVSGTYAGLFEIEIRPSLSRQMVGLTYLIYPALPTSAGSYLPFPEPLATLIYNIAMNFISTKQGDGTNVYSISEADILKQIQNF